MSSNLDRFSGHTEVVTDVFNTLREIDPLAALRPWWENSTAPVISDARQLPTSASEARQYADRLYIPTFEPNEQRKEMWISFYYSGNASMEDIIAGTRNWEHSVFRRQLQCMKTAVVGWGLFSTRNMDTDRMQAYFRRNHNLDLSIRWRIVIEENGRQLPDHEKIRALHFEVDANDLFRAKTRFIPLNTLELTIFPFASVCA